MPAANHFLHATQKAGRVKNPFAFERGKIYILKRVCNLWPSGDTGVGSIPTRISGYTQRTNESLDLDQEMSVGIKIKREVHMEAGKNTKTGSMMMTLKTRFNLKFKIIVAVVVGFLMAAPLTRVYK